MAEIGDIKRFERKEKLAYNASFTIRQNQSGNRNIKDHIIKHGPSMLKFLLITTAHSLIRYSKKMKMKFLSMVKRPGKKDNSYNCLYLARNNLIDAFKKYGIRGQHRFHHRKKDEGHVSEGKDRAKAMDRKDTIKLIRNKRSRGMSEEFFTEGHSVNLARISSDNQYLGEDES